MKKLILLASALLLSGCGAITPPTLETARSPRAISGLSVTELSRIDDYRLCVAYTPRELYSPSERVRIEVAKRARDGLDCRRLYSYESTSAVSSQSNQRTSNQVPRQVNQAYIVRTEEVIGARICHYSDGSAVRIGGGRVCPRNN